jgi:hypothetical protein
VTDPRMLSPNVAKMAIELLNRVPIQGAEVDAFCQIRAALRVVAEAPVPAGEGEVPPEVQRDPRRADA